MDRIAGTRILAACLVFVGCSPTADGPDDRGTAGGGGPGAAEVAHETHVGPGAMPDDAGAGREGMAAPDHGVMAAGPSARGGSAGQERATHGGSAQASGAGGSTAARSAMASGTSGGSAPPSATVDHQAGHADGAAQTASGTRVAPGAGAGAVADHAQHATAPQAPRSSGSPGAGPQALGSRTSPASAPGDHAQHAATPISGSSAARPAPERAEPPTAAGVSRGASAPSPAPPDEGTAGLLTLVQELLRDPVVQRRIAEDPALRESWEDPAVREVILRPEPDN